MGTDSELAGKADSCAGCPNQAECASAPKGPDPDLVAITRRMAEIKHKILVLSGKGGVGKSTFAAQLAFALARQGRDVRTRLAGCAAGPDHSQVSVSRAWVPGTMVHNICYQPAAAISGRVVVHVVNPSSRDQLELPCPACTL